MVGFNMNYEKKGVLKLDGSVRCNHNDGDAYSKTSSENFVSTTGSFSNSIRQLLAQQLVERADAP